MNLSSTIKSIQDIMRKDDGVDGDAQRIGQLTWMLFLKIFDQCEETWEDDALDQRKTYQSPIPEPARWRNWAKHIEDDKGKKKPQISGSELIRHVQDVVFPALQDLDIASYASRVALKESTEKAKDQARTIAEARARVVREVFADTNNYMKSGTQMLAVIEKLDEAVNFHDIKSRGQLGDVYEQILNDLRSAGNAGEFYTPRALTEFMVRMVNPDLKKRETVLDPACGTGGFLTATIAHLESQIDERSSAKDGKAIAQCIRGMEKKQLPHLLCVTNMLLHGIEVPAMIEHRNTLAHSWNDWKLTERVDCVITNPPFGGMEDDGVGADYPSDIRTRETADMFLVLIVKKLLKEKGGRGAVVLPDGTLFGEGVKAKVKKLLMEECHLHTIIRLPNGVFNPYTSIKTNLLFFTRGRPTDTIWYYEHRYPAGVKSYSKTRPLKVEEFQPIADWWGSEADGFASRTESEQAWKVDFKKLKEEAEAKAQPHWTQAEALGNQAAALVNEVKDLRDKVKGEKDSYKRTLAELEISTRTDRIEALRQQARDQQTQGDRHYWPIYNLDAKNPNTLEEETHDPDKLLAKYKALQAEIADTEAQLKKELSAALAHHFEGEAAA
ncbi:MAG: type I restriction-modification system subunit M [Prosthecobacter sp.]|nr:type I restriction-modification system subunit M [Prosthecobacter sp.]